MQFEGKEVSAMKLLNLAKTCTTYVAANPGTVSCCITSASATEQRDPLGNCG